MPGTLRFDLIEAEEPPGCSSLQGDTFWIRVSLGLRVYHFLCKRKVGGRTLSRTVIDRTCSFPVENLSTPLVLEVLDSPDSAPISFATLSVGTILESKSTDAVLHLNQGGKVWVCLGFVLSEGERAKIAAMRMEAAKRRSSNVEPQSLARHATTVQHQTAQNGKRAWNSPSSRSSFVRAVVENEANRDLRAGKPLNSALVSRLQHTTHSQALLGGEDSFARADFLEMDSSEESLRESLSSTPDLQPGGNMGDGTGALSPIKEDVVRTRSNGNNSDGNKSSATSGLPQQAVIVCGSDQASLILRTPEHGSRTSQVVRRYNRRVSKKSDGVKGALSTVVSQFIAVCAAASIAALMWPKPKKCTRCNGGSSPDRPYSLYTVKRGDTLNSLVPHGDYCDPKSRFRELNPSVCDVNRIYAGQVLKLP